MTGRLHKNHPHVIVVRQMRDQIENLQAQLRFVNDAFMPQVIFPTEWELTSSERRVLAALYTSPNGYLRQAALSIVIDSGEGEAAIRTRISGIRRKIPRLEIIPISDEGYQLTRASREIIKQALETV